MDNKILIDLYVQWTSENNDTSITRFVQACAKELQNSKRSITPIGENNMMPSFVTSKVKIATNSQFGGRGGVWAWCPVELVVEWLQTQEDEVKEHCGKYLAWVNKYGKAWIRYSGTSKAGIAFEVRIMGSRLDHKTLIMRLDAEYAEGLEMMGATPFKLGLEPEGIACVSLDDMLIKFNNANIVDSNEVSVDNESNMGEVVASSLVDVSEEIDDAVDNSGDDSSEDEEIEFV